MQNCDYRQDRADSQIDDLTRRGVILEDRVAKVTHDRMTEEHNHEVLKKENIRLRDELERVRNDNHRDKEQWKRDQDNMMGTVNLDHKR